MIYWRGLSAYSRNFGCVRAWVGFIRSFLCESLPAIEQQHQTLNLVGSAATTFWNRRQLSPPPLCHPKSRLERGRRRGCFLLSSPTTASYIDEATIEDTSMLKPFNHRRFYPSSWQMANSGHRETLATAMAVLVGCDIAIHPRQRDVCERGRD